MKKSGVSGQDDVRLTTALFNEVKVDHLQEDVGRKFRIYQCCIVLRDVPKYGHPNEFRDFDDSEDRKISEDNKTVADSEDMSNEIGGGSGSDESKQKSTRKTQNK